MVKTRLDSNLTQVNRIRLYSTEMKVLPPSSVTTTTNPPPDATTTQKPRTPKLPSRGIRQWHILASVLLSRPPLLVARPDGFEKQVERYQEYIERHQYTRFPLNFFFKKGSIGEKQWKRLHPFEPRKSGSGLIRQRPLDEDEPAEPEWIVGGKLDSQVMNSRRNGQAPTPGARRKRAGDEEELSDEERRDLEHYAEQDSEIGEQRIGMPDYINGDKKLLERHPEETLYCLVKRSKQFHEKSGRKGLRPWSLIGDEALGLDDHGNPEGLHIVRSHVLESPGLLTE
jgi:hypothetical protein